MKNLGLLILFILQPVLLPAGIDNYLFSDKQTCLECLKEIYTSSPIKDGESFECKGRDSNNPKSRFFVMRFFTKKNQIEEKSQDESGSGTSQFFFKQGFMMKQQSGLNESKIKNRCPKIHEKQSK